MRVMSRGWGVIDGEIGVGRLGFTHYFTKNNWCVNGGSERLSMEGGIKVIGSREVGVNPIGVKKSSTEGIRNKKKKNLKKKRYV